MYIKADIDLELLCDVCGELLDFYEKKGKIYVCPCSKCEESHEEDLRTLEKDLNHLQYEKEQLERSFT